MGLLNFLSLRHRVPDMTPAYMSIVKQARRPGFYSGNMVPDSFDGRFDMLALHVHLVLRRLRQHGVARDHIGQSLFDLFFRDMDQAMREAGIGDLGVSKKIRKMAQAFYGRAAAYDEVLGRLAPAAFAQSRLDALTRVLTRNLYPDGASDMVALQKLAAYILRTEKFIASKSIDDIVRGHFFDDYEADDGH